MAYAYSETKENLAIQDQVLVETALGGQSTGFHSVIVRLAETELWLGLISTEAGLADLPPGQPVRLVVTRKNGTMLGSSQFLRTLDKSPSRFFAVTRPTSFEHIEERRSGVRYPIELPVQFRHLDAATDLPVGKGSSGTTVDISPSGFLIRTETPLVEGDGLDLKLYLSLSDGIATRARVLRAVRVSVGDGHPIEAALELTRIMAVDQQKIAQFILAAELKKRRAALQLESDRMRSPISAVGSPSPLGADSNWPEPSDSDRDLASFVLTDFEDRRVLCAPDQLEIKDACIAGVIELRHFLTEMIGELAPASELAAQLRAIRAACRKFLDEFEPQADSGQFASRHRGDWALGTALGELRGVTGVWVAAIAETHGVVVGPSLAAILPATPSDRD